MRHTTTITFIREIQSAGARRVARARGLVAPASLLALLVAGLLPALGGLAMLGAWGHAGQAAHAGPLHAPSLSPGGGDNSWKSATGPTPTSVTGGEPGKVKSPSPTVIVNMTPISEAGLVGWERDALRDLAEVLNWPNTVTYDSSGRLKVQAYGSPIDWSVAHVRAFDFNAGAEAAFMAEQEDTRLAGFRLRGATFYSYRAYSASLSDRAGVVIERRFRWLADTWILGVDIHRGGPNAQVPDPSVIAADFLALAVRRGLPPPPGGGVPTPNPTWVLPPLPTTTALACGLRFSDVTPDYWSYPYIKQLACQGIISGYGDGTFRPENSTTRAQLVKMLVLSQHWNLVPPSEPTFRDVGLQHPFYRYIETAAARRLISGYGDGIFRPDAYVTRAQVAKMLVRARGWEPSTSGITPCDVDSAHWAWNYVRTAMQHGLFSGYGDNCFRPDLMASRAQLAKVLSLAQR